MEVSTGKMPENGTQSAIEEKSPIGDLNEIGVDSDETELDVVIDGGVSGVGSPPDGGADSAETAPVVVQEGVGDGDGSAAADDGLGDRRETAPIAAEQGVGGEEDGVSSDGRGDSPKTAVYVSGGGGSDSAPGVVDGDGHRDAGFAFDLNAEVKSMSDDEIEGLNVDIEQDSMGIMEILDGAGDDGDEEGQPDRKRMRHGGYGYGDGDGDGDGDGEPSEEQPNNNFRLFGFDINSNQDEEEDGTEDGGASGLNAGGGSPSIQPSELGLRQEDDLGSSEDDDAISGGGGGDSAGGGEPPIQQPMNGFRLFGHDIN